MEKIIRVMRVESLVMRVEVVFWAWRFPKPLRFGDGFKPVSNIFYFNP